MYQHRATIETKQVKITRYELWGNAKDGFDTNNFFNVYTGDCPKTDRGLLTLVKNCFEGNSFAWNEGTHRPMRRQEIQIHWPGYMQEGLFDVIYAGGHIIGQVEITDKE